MTVPGIKMPVVTAVSDHNGLSTVQNRLPTHLVLTYGTANTFTSHVDIQLYIQ